MSDARPLCALIAADSFKDALSASEVCRAIAQGLRKRELPLVVREFPLADGGEGTFAVLTQHLRLSEVRLPTVDSLFRPIEASYGIGNDGRLAVIEMAQASGLQLLASHERSAENATTLGTGILIADAISRGAQQIVLAIGGSASNDGGIGVASALGWKFLDRDEQPLREIGANLSRITRIELPAHRPHAQIEVLCDVANPLYGPHGAAYIYAQQKGADEATIEQLDGGLRHLANCVAKTIPNAPSPDTPGAGAAGGLGFGAMAFLGARLSRGVDRILELTQFEQALSNATLVITGEGSLDAQTEHGKLIQGICRRANIRNIPAVALCGRLSLAPSQIQAMGLSAAYSINTGSGDLAQRLANTAKNLTATARTIPLPI